MRATGSFITIFVWAVLCFVFFNEALAAGVTTFNVVDLGAEPDGETDAAEIFQRAWCAACGSPDPAKIYVPEGMFLIRQAYFSGPCENNNIVFEIWGTLVAPSDYNVIGNDDNWLAFEYVDGVAIIGGKLYGQGAGLWACKDSGNECPKGATASGVKIMDVTYQNIVGTSATEVAVKFDCSKKNPCKRIRMSNVKLKFKQKRARASCAYVAGEAYGQIEPSSCL
nr:polygalacturonase-like [Ipomoea trifida]